MDIQIERRNLVERQRLTERIRNEFMEMPGLVLTLPQASRLFGLSPEACARVLSELVRSRQLSGAREERYRSAR
jgi:hypothetical protein